MTKVSLPKRNEQGFYEMRFESIGGLGANVAGQILAEAAVLGMGLNGSNFSSYGSEKKGSVVRSFIRLGDPDREIRSNSPVERPHLLAIFHSALGTLPETTAGLYPDSVVIVNTRQDPAQARDRLQLAAGTVATLDALGLAIEAGSRVNTVMLGAVVRLSGFLDPDAVLATLNGTLGARYPALAEKNRQAFQLGYDRVRYEEFAADGRYPERPFQRFVSPIGYETATLGGALLTPGNTALKDLSVSRQGFRPVFLREKCIDCALCEFTCPDYSFRWVEGTDAKGRPAMVLEGINYQHCKGCLKCVEVCPTAALVAEREEGE